MMANIKEFSRIFNALGISQTLSSLVKPISTDVNLSQYKVECPNYFTHFMKEFKSANIKSSKSSSLLDMLIVDRGMNKEDLYIEGIPIRILRSFIIIPFNVLDDEERQEYNRNLLSEIANIDKDMNFRKVIFISRDAFVIGTDLSTEDFADLLESKLNINISDRVFSLSDIFDNSNEMHLLTRITDIYETELNDGNILKYLMEYVSFLYLYTK
jgi:hypothetical protein